MNRKVMCKKSEECSRAVAVARQEHVQAKLTVGAANDPLEHEADAMADRVMGMRTLPLAGGSSQHLQRKCQHCEEEEQAQRKPLSSFIQKKESAGGMVASEQVSGRINANNGRGNSMDNTTRSFMESSFNRDFSQVRIHADSEAIQMNRELNARAFTVGNDIYFNEGQYQPVNDSGKHLLAHELTHTIQQSHGIERKIQKTPRPPKKTIWLHIGFDSSAVADRATMRKLRASIAAEKSAIANCCSAQSKACDVQVKTLYDWNRNDKPAPADRDYDMDVAADVTRRDNNISKINTGKSGGVRLLVTGSGLSQTWQGARILANANSGTDNLIWNVNTAPEETLPHETGHIAGYSGGDIEGSVHHSDPDNLMSRGDIRHAGALPDADWCDKVAALAV